MKKNFLPLLSLFIVSFLSTVSAQEAGDEWITRRGDDTPGLFYESAVTTTDGRVVALNRSGALMTSRDRGASWTFGQITVGGSPVEGTFTELYQVPGGALIAIMKRLEESSAGGFDYIVRTYFVTSRDGGNTWSLAPFPKNSVTFRQSGQEFFGVNITSLHPGPGGELLAYGTTSGTNQPGFVLWSIGGVIFRQVGNSWEQAFFGNGPVDKIASDGGRAVAAVYNGVLDSIDGAGWNGYTFDQAQFTLDGQPMDFDTQNRLRVLDIEIVGGNYIAQGATFLPFRNEPGIDTNIADGLYKFVSPTPFSGARNWSAFTQPRYHGPFTKIGGRVLAARGFGVYGVAQTGGGFDLQDDTVVTNGRTLAVSGNTGIVAVGNSESAWNSNDAGTSWTKVWDKDPGPNLRPIGEVNGVIFARGNRRELWSSRDGGESWQLNEGDFPGYNAIQSAGPGKLIAPIFGREIAVSRDGGQTWERQEITDRGELGDILRLASGRLLATGNGLGLLAIRGEGPYLLSDDEGENWRAVNAGMGFGEDVGPAVQTPTGRIIVPTSSNFPFFPLLNISDDDGETWRKSPVLQRVPGLDLIAGTEDETVFDPMVARVSPSGRIIMIGNDEIITSDDDGESWIVRRALEAETPDVFNRYRLQDLVRVGNRWIAIGSLQPDRVSTQFLLVSDDDGSTWGQIDFPTNQFNTSLSKLTLAEGGRLIITGTNGAVFTKDFDLPLSADSPEQTVLEGNTETVAIPRPAIAGEIEARFGTVSRTAVAGTDFVATGGILTWEADDEDAKMVSIETINNFRAQAEREFLLQLTFETDDGIFGTIETPVGILDDDGPANPGIIFDGITSVRSSETGPPVEIPIALERRPTSDVTVTISGVNEAEGTLSTNTLTFTPENSSIYQIVALQGVDDPYPDGDSTYEILFETSTEDQFYAGFEGTSLTITNVSDEPHILGGEFFARLGEAYSNWVAANDIPTALSGPFSDPNEDGLQNLSAYAFGISPVGSTVGSPLEIGSDLTITFRVSDAAENLTFSSQISPTLNFLDWEAGPAPEEGDSVDGFTSYTVNFPAESEARFARIVVGIAE